MPSSTQLATSKYSSNSLTPAEQDPAAWDFPQGAVVLSLSGTDRSEMRAGMAVIAFAIFGMGVFVGHQVARRGRR